MPTLVIRVVQTLQQQLYACTYFILSSIWFDFFVTYAVILLVNLNNNMHVDVYSS